MNSSVPVRTAVSFHNHRMIDGSRRTVFYIQVRTSELFNRDRRNMTARFHLLILNAWSITLAGFGLTIEPETGFQTNLPLGTGSSFGNHPFCTFSLEPVWATDTGGAFRFTVTGPLSATKFLGGGPEELNLESGASIGKHSPSRVTKASLGVGYHLTPAAYDPTAPGKYLECYVTCERASVIGKVIPEGSYGACLISDCGATTRMDFRNLLQLKLSAGFERYLLFAKMGFCWNVSNTEGAGYLQPLAAVGSTIDFNERNLLFFQLYTACSFYRPSTVPVLVTIGRGRRGKRTDTLLTYEHHDPKIPFTSCYCGFDRELSRRSSLHFYYMAVLFGRGTPHSLLLSHQSGIIYSWRLGQP